jgi:hypothetical protein
MPHSLRKPWTISIENTFKTHRVVLKSNYAKNCGCYQSLTLWILVPIDVQRKGGKIAFVFEAYSSGML